MQWGRLDIAFNVGANFVRVHSGSKNLRLDRQLVLLQILVEMGEVNYRCLKHKDEKVLPLSLY